MLYKKKLVPYSILNQFATTMTVDINYGINYGRIDFTSAKVEITFYDENQTRIIHLPEMKINELPVTITTVPKLNLATPAELTNFKIMLEMQRHQIFEKVKEKYGLQYYDDAYERDDLLFCPQEILYTIK